ncbi:MAG: lipoate--protein ligase [Firmicutes bacterium]|nr:lipoate--protein ligase [Bacillota bacterium]
MKCIVSPFNSCYCNIASEEYYLSHFDEDLFYLYINAPCVVIGKNQNAFAEVNRDYVEEHHIDVVRRMSGGGAVYHDLGNLNYGFITKNKGKDVSEVFKEFTAPIVETLRSLGANVEVSGRNDIQLDGRKISGTAQYHSSSKVLFHGTLLFTADMDAVEGSLNVSREKYEDKTVKSVRARVVNLKDHLPPMTIEEFAENIIEKTLEAFPDVERYELTEEDKTAIQKLADQKYSTWDWVYGNSMEFTFRNTFRYPMGTVDLHLRVAGGMIEEARIYGDFFGKLDASEIGERLSGIAYEKEAAEAALADIDLSDYMFGLSKELFFEKLLSGGVRDV